MRRFVIKFFVVILLFFAPAAAYKYYVIPNMSGDIGKLGMIPFGKEYEGLDVLGYCRRNVSNASVVTVTSEDSLSFFSVLTVGDSFSQQGESGYQWKLSHLLNCPIANYFNGELNVFARYMTLLNGGFIKAGQTVIVECVERGLVPRLSNLDFNTRLDTVARCVASDTGSGHLDKPFLNRFFSWIRLNLNIDNPIVVFKLNKQCFIHPRFGNTLHIYNSLRDMDGDLLWHLNGESDYSKSAENLRRLIDVSEKKGIDLVILIATDRYDAYEPWIEGAHQYNPTLDNIPVNPKVFNTKPCIQKAIREDIMDVYKVNNTHWSLVGADIIAENLYNNFFRQ